MQVRVIESRRGSPDGIATPLYHAGKVYGPKTVPRMPADLAAVFVREGWGEEVNPAAVEAKALAAAPENKMREAEENKDDVRDDDVFVEVEDEAEAHAAAEAVETGVTPPDVGAR